MRILLSISLMLLACLSVYSQEVIGSKSADQDGRVDVATTDVSAPQTTAAEMPTHAYDASAIKQSIMPLNQTDSLHLPRLNMQGQVQPISMYPMSWAGWYDWQLHKGLNLNVGASVFAQFGKHARHGAGFSQNIAMMYAVPLSNKLSFAVGGYLNNTYWAHNSFRDAGISAVLGYKFDEHWEVYLYGQKSLTDNARLPYYIYDINNVGDRIGAAVKYNFNNNASIQISVEGVSQPAPKRYMPEQPIRPSF